MNVQKLQEMKTSGADLIKGPQPSLLDPTGILNSVQTLVSENDALKSKVEEQKTKLEQQSDRIFHLLELNHK